MIGTTDVAFSGSLDEVAISPEEITYLCKLISNYFSKPLKQQDVINSWSGVRPLLAVEGEELRALSRDYSVEYTTAPAPAVTIYGGKITTYRQSSLEAINKLQPLFPSLKNHNLRSVRFLAQHLTLGPMRNTYTMPAKNIFGLRRSSKNVIWQFMARAANYY